MNTIEELRAEVAQIKRQKATGIHFVANDLDMSRGLGMSGYHRIEFDLDKARLALVKAELERLALCYEHDLLTVQSNIRALIARVWGTEEKEP